MWAITSFYNPVRYRRRLANYRIFRANLRAPLVTVELSFDGRFELTKSDADILIQISGGAVLWQKERLLNVALKSIPPHVDAIAWIDCDAIFGRRDWPEQATAQLQHNDVVQLFSDLLDLKRDEHGVSSKHEFAPASTQGIVSLHEARHSDTFVIPSKSPSVRPVQRGIAWAAKRTLLEKHGFYDACIIGSGDRAMAFAMYGRFDDVMCSLAMNDAQRNHYLRWAIPFHQSIAGRMGHVPGRIYHLWHGDIKDRNYSDRHQLLSKFDFDPVSDIRIGTGGAWRWAQPKPELASFLRRFFESRTEDGAHALGHG